MTDQAARLLPLSPPTFQILLSLADGPRHGYEIIQDVRERTDDEVRLTASTLYDALARLLDDQVIDELERAPAGQPADGRRRYYRLTPLGRAVASLEARRLERLIDMARAKRLLPSARPRGRR